MNSRIVNIKTSRADRKALKDQAAKYADGNLSAWMRYAGLHHKPKRGEKVSLDFKPKKK